MKPHQRWPLLILFAAIPSLLHAQSQPVPEVAPVEPPQQGHDISKVDPAPLGGAIAVPLPERQRRRLKKYEIPELVGSRQAIGSQLIDGELPRPRLDYYARNGNVDQRISFFDGGLVVIRMAGAGGTIHKRVIIPAEAVRKYLDAASAEALRSIRESELSAPNEKRFAFLRVYDASGKPIERAFDPSGAQPRKLHDGIAPIEDLLRALSEDRTVTSTIAGYEPKIGDELVGDDRKTYRVERIMTDGIVQLRCTSQPTVVYVAKKDLYNYFVGRAQ